MVFINGRINVCTVIKVKDYLKGDVKVTYKPS